MYIANLRFLLAVASLSTLIGVQSHATIIVTNRYDMEADSSYVTQTSWTHMDQTIAYTGTSAGFDLANSHFFTTGIDAGSSTQSPIDVTRDFVMSYYTPTNTPSIVFRDILPAYSTNVSFTVYRSRPGGTYGSYWQLYLSENGGPLQEFPYLPEYGEYQTVYTGSFGITPSDTAGTLDFYFFNRYEPSPNNVKLNGIEAIYTTVMPEPSTVMLLGLGGMILYHRRRQA